MVRRWNNFPKGHYFKFHVGCRDVQTAFSSVPLNACRVTTSTSSTPKRSTTKKQKKKHPEIQPADVRSLSTTHSSPSSPAVTKSDCEVGWNWTQDTSVIRRWLVCQYQWCGKEIGTRKTFITSDVVTERKAAIQASPRISFVLKHPNYFLCLINLPSCWLRMKVKGCNLLTRRPANQESDSSSYPNLPSPKLSTQTCLEAARMYPQHRRKCCPQQPLISQAPPQVPWSAREDRDLIYTNISIYRDLFDLHNLYLVSNWVLNPQLKLTNKMSWCPRWYWGDIQIITIYTYCTRVPQPSTTQDKEP